MEIKTYKHNGVDFIDIFPILSNAVNFKEVVEFIANNSASTIAMVEARAFCFAPSVQLLSSFNRTFIPIRKAGKLPNPVKKFKAEKEYGISELEYAQYSETDCITIFDDILATGQTAEAVAKQLIEDNCKVKLNFVFVVEIKSLEGRNRLLKYGKVESKYFK